MTVVQLLTTLNFFFTIWTNVSQNIRSTTQNRRGHGVAVSDLENMELYLCLGILGTASVDSHGIPGHILLIQLCLSGCKKNSDDIAVLPFEVWSNQKQIYLAPNTLKMYKRCNATDKFCSRTIPSSTFQTVSSLYR